MEKPHRGMLSPSSEIGKNKAQMKVMVGQHKLTGKNSIQQRNGSESHVNSGRTVEAHSSGRIICLQDTEIYLPATEQPKT